MHDTDRQPDTPAKPEAPAAPARGADAGTDFAREAGQANAGLLRELLDMILHNKKWWLIPVIVVLLAIGIIVLLGATAAAPFIYPLF